MIQKEKESGFGKRFEIEKEFDRDRIASQPVGFKEKIKSPGRWPLAGRGNTWASGPCMRFLQATLTLTLFLASACNEIFSPDITAETLTVNSPSDSLHTAENIISFWWEQNDLIERYELRITQGISGNTSVLVDTTMLDNTVSYFLETDQIYEWQVRGKNEGTETEWVRRTLILDQTASDKATALNMDGDTLASGASDTLRWQSADFPIEGLQFPHTDSLVIYRKNDSLTIGASYFFEEDESREFSLNANAPTPMNGPGEYFWRVISVDRAGNRNESEQFKFIVQ